MDPKYLHDTRKKMNDLAISHNRLTTLCACLLNEVQSLKREINEMKGIKTVQTNSSSSSSSNMLPPPQTANGGRRVSSNNNTSNSQSMNQFRYDPNNIASLQADEILKHLSVPHN